MRLAQTPQRRARPHVVSLAFRRVTDNIAACDPIVPNINEVVIPAPLVQDFPVPRDAEAIFVRTLLRVPADFPGLVLLLVPPSLHSKPPKPHVALVVLTVCRLCLAPSLLL